MGLGVLCVFICAGLMTPSSTLASRSRSTNCCDGSCNDCSTDCCDRPDAPCDCSDDSEECFDSTECQDSIVNVININLNPSRPISDTDITTKPPTPVCPACVCGCPSSSTNSTSTDSSSNSTCFCCVPDSSEPTVLLGLLNTDASSLAVALNTTVATAFNQLLQQVPARFLTAVLGDEGYDLLVLSTKVRFTLEVPKLKGCLAALLAIILLGIDTAVSTSPDLYNDVESFISGLS